MNAQIVHPVDLSPDRLFRRLTLMMVTAAAVMAIATLVIFENASERHALYARQANAGAERAIKGRQFLIDVERVAHLPDGPVKEMARARLDRDVSQFYRSEVLRPVASSIAPRRSGRTEGTTAADAPAAEFPDLTAEGRFDPTMALSELLRTIVLPHLDIRARRDALAAEQSRRSTRLVVLGALAAQTLIWALLVVVGAMPMRRQLRGWIARTAETNDNNRFRMLHDPLTQMPNAIYLHAYLERVIAGMDRATKQLAVLRVDLDKYLNLRQTLGQRAGDEVIRIAARRIQHDLRQGDFAAHLGHDDFVVVAADIDDANDAAAIAQRVHNALAKAFSIHGGARRMSCSIGVTLLADDKADVERVLANSEIALREAQASGTGQIRYFRESQRHEVERRETMFAELLAGLENGQINAYFQPQIDAVDGALSGFEALVRWRHPRHGLLTPAAFLDFAEQTDLTERIGEVVLTQSLAAMRAWDAAGLSVPKVGVNFAMAQLRDPRLIEKIKWEVERFDIVPERLAIEVLETVLIKSDADLVVRNLQGLASAGFQIELDDFGTGHASIANLRRFRVDSIKIDGSFIFGIEDNSEQQQLTASMIALAKALGIGTLAEGVETDAALETVRTLGCDRVQGFLVAKPMSLVDTFGWLASTHPAKPRSDTTRTPARGDPNTP